MTEAEAAGESVAAITDALLVVSRFLIAISARSIARVDQTLTIPQFRGLPPHTVAQMVQPLVGAGLVVCAADSALSRERKSLTSCR